MKEVDARGLSCPEPLMLTANALKGATEAVKVLVTEPHQKMNVEKFAKDHGKTPTSTEKDGYFEVVIEQRHEKKELKLVVTFHTTADAKAMEKACKEQNVPGRIIPVPRTISAGCGLAWCAALEEREEIAAMMKKAGIEEEDMHECMV